MHQVKKLIGQIIEELDGAEEYAKCAMNWKDENQGLSKTYTDMAKVEMQHAQILQGYLSNMYDAMQVSDLSDILDEMIYDKMAVAKAQIDLCK